MWKPKFEAENDDHNVAKSQNCYQKFTFWRHFQCFIILVAYYNKSLAAMILVHESWLSSWLLGHSLLLLACLLSFWGLGGGYKVQAKFCPMLQLLLPFLCEVSNHVQAHWSMFACSFHLAFFSLIDPKCVSLKYTTVHIMYANINIICWW